MPETPRCRRRRNRARAMLPGLKPMPGPGRNDSGGCGVRPGDAMWLNFVGGDSTELCNGWDEDCDGIIDEGFDEDGDGHSTCETAPLDVDCDDTRAFINPGQAELCDGFDNDCDGKWNEDFGDECPTPRCAVGLPGAQGRGLNCAECISSKLHYNDVLAGHGVHASYARLAAASALGSFPSASVKAALVRSAASPGAPRPRPVATRTIRSCSARRSRAPSAARSRSRRACWCPSSLDGAGAGRRSRLYRAPRAPHTLPCTWRRRA